MVQVGVTVPQPQPRDIEILQVVGNVSYKILQNCSKCNSTYGAGDHKEWVGTSKDVLYIAFPIMVAWGVLTGFVNVIVVARQIRVSNDSYSLGLVTASILLLLCGGLIKSQEYLGHTNMYQYMYGYIKPLNDWLWYSAIWLLIVMALERSMTVTQHRSKSLCTPVQAAVVTVMVYSVCFISALPQFWEYEVVETFDYGSNQTLALSQLSEAADTPEYKIMYFWYTMSITIFLPYPTLLIMAIILCRGMKHSDHSRRRLSTKHGAGNILNRKVTEEMHVTRLFIVLILLYFLFTGPFTFLRLIDRVAPHMTTDSTSLLYKGLYDIFEFTFYFYFSVLFLLFCSYSDKFRYSLLKTCCCCCKPSTHKKVKTNANSNSMRES